MRTIVVEMSAEAQVKQARASLARRSYRWLRRQVDRSRHVVPMLPRVGKGVVNALLARSDDARWRSPENLEVWWEARTARLATLVPPASRVIEFGAGRCRLPHYLDAASTYFASDLVTRIPDTIVCDLNHRPLPDLRHLQLDVAFFAGVLEYIADLHAVAAWLSTQVRSCVASYDAVDSERWTGTRIAELGRRKYFGYMNDYEPAEFVRVFESSGFRCARTDRWESQELYLFRREFE
jgi:hypothetical protein